jgi:O-antigen ligase
VAARLDRFDRSTALLVSALVAISVILGALAGLHPIYAVAGAFGLAFVALVLQDVGIGVAAMAVFAYVDTLPTSGMISPAKLAGVLLAASWLATIATRREQQLPNVHPVLTWLLVLFAAWTTLSITWAEDEGAAFEAVFRYVPNLLLVPIFFTALRTEQHYVRLLWVFVGASLMTTLVAFASPPPDPTTGDVARAASTAGDANELAASLVVGMVLSLALAALPRYSALVRWALVGTALLCLLAIFLSLSRGGLVAVCASVVVAVVLAGRYRGRAIAGAIFVLLIGLAYFTMFASLPARERVMEVNGGTGRVDLWTVAWRMVQDNAVGGVGGGNFAGQTIHYLLQPGAIQRDDFIISSTPLVAHNTFLQVLTEGGFPLLACFLGIIIGAVWCALRAIGLFERRDRWDLSLLTRAVLVALAGFMTASVFISANYSKLLWMLLALGPVALWVARRTPDSSSS